ncbi:MAG: c-type cytochrome biogenesis protein CcsB [Lachnospiraceae bacterium]|nr:c-type cytochrome biogenesis protein CcsB [Lachnospiraceae bacterium]
MWIAIENIIFTTALILYVVSMLLYFLFALTKKDILGRIATIVQIVGLVIHTGAIVIRGIGAGRLPLTNQYEFASAFAWGLTLVTVIFMAKYRFRALGAFASPLIILIIGYAAMQSKEVHELMPALKSSWLGIHVSTAIIAYGSFGLSFVLSIGYLFRDRMKPESFLGQHIPTKEKLDLISYRGICLGILFLTFTMVTGAIWAEQAWGSYWSWDPKETWSLVTWLVYAVYLHLRIFRKWKGKGAAIFAIIGFIAVIFTYIGVNTFLPGVHSYK